METLRNLGGQLTYRDLLARTDTLLRSTIRYQTPQIEVTCDEDLNAVFLRGVIEPSAPYFLVSYEKPEFILKAGAAHGIAPPGRDGTTLLCLYPMVAQPADLKNATKSIGRRRGHRGQGGDQPAESRRDGFPRRSRNV